MGPLPHEKIVNDANRFYKVVHSYLKLYPTIWDGFPLIVFSFLV